MTRRRGIAVAGVALGVGVLVGLGWLVVQALRGASAAEGERHEVVLGRLFDELERELSTLVAREESRSFLEYRYYYVPEEDNALANPALVLSPLARPSDDPAIVGWFQLDADGTLHSPLRPRANEFALAEQQGWRGEPDLDPELVRAVRATPTWRVAASPPPRAPVVAPAPMQTKDDLLLNRGSFPRKARQVQTLSTKSANFASYRGEDLEQVVAQQQLAVGGPDVDVEVTPMSGVRVREHLVLSRTVRTQGLEHRQGLVLRVAALAQALERAVLEGSSLRPQVSLAWEGAPEVPRAWRATHRFADPFADLRVTATIDRVPELAGNEANVTRALALALALAVLGGGLGLGRAVWTELEFARRRSDFVAAVSHELKTPLTTIRMYAEMLRDGMVASPERQREYHATITAESDRLGRLIANVLELARLERGGPVALPVVGAVEPVLRDALEIVRPQVERAGFRIALTVAADLPAARIDRDALVQVVVNLVDNAVKFAADGDRTIALTLRPTSDGRVELMVRDHGPGVPGHQQARVFEPFWRGERELTRRTKGTGIGLALVRGLVERMGGEVRAHNHPEGGFEVVLTLAAGAR